MQQLGEGLHVVALEGVDVAGDELLLFVVGGIEVPGVRWLSASVALARCRALFTEATDVSSSSATSSAFQRRTSRRIKTARCLGGRCCSAPMNASRIDSRATASSPGSPPSGSARPSGIGSIQNASERVPPRGTSALDGDPRSIGRARRWRALSMSRHTLVAMRYSQERTEDRPSKRSNAFHALTRVSWAASSASKADPSIR